MHSMFGPDVFKHEGNPTGHLVVIHSAARLDLLHRAAAPRDGKTDVAVLRACDCAITCVQAMIKAHDFDRAATAAAVAAEQLDPPAATSTTNLLEVSARATSLMSKLGHKQQILRQKESTRASPIKTAGDIPVSPIQLFVRIVHKFASTIEAAASAVNSAKAWVQEFVGWASVAEGAAKMAVDEFADWAGMLPSSKTSKAGSGSKVSFLVCVHGTVHPPPFRSHATESRINPF